MKSNEIESLVRANIRSLCPYSTARDEYSGPIGVFLDANESPYPTGYNRYPDPHQKALKSRISQIKGTAVENIFIGNGSDEAIDMVFRVFCVPGRDNVVAIAPSYGMYAVAADMNDISVRPFMLDDDFGFDNDALLAACDANTKAIFLCTPNNPTGNAFSNAQIVDLLERFKGMVIVDEAYIDFCSEPSLVAKIGEYANLIVLQTLSKAWGMAGLRVGLAFADEYVIRLMSMVKYPYNINQLAQEAALKALQVDNSSRVAEIVAQRAVVADAVASLSFVEKVYPSEANFILAKVDDADRVYNHLLATGIIVRNRNRVKGCMGCVRITIGLPEENVKLLESLKLYEEGDIRG